MNIAKRLLSICLLSVFITSCSKGKTTLTLEERLHNAYLDVLETKKENIRP